jgi:hypothetical protein
MRRQRALDQAMRNGAYVSQKKMGVDVAQKPPLHDAYLRDGSGLAKLSKMNVRARPVSSNEYL